jgi:hypothetical protein
MAHGSIHWSECITRDVERAKAHYAEIAGWTFDAMPAPGGTTYWLARSGDTMVAGLMDLAALEEAGDIPPHWMTYIEVDDVDAAVATAARTGASIARPPFHVPGVGRIAMIADPGGALAGYIQPEEEEPRA